MTDLKNATVIPRELDDGHCTGARDDVRSEADIYLWFDGATVRRHKVAGSHEVMKLKSAATSTGAGKKYDDRPDVGMYSSQCDMIVKLLEKNMSFFLSLQTAAECTRVIKQPFVKLPPEGNIRN